MKKTGLAFIIIFLVSASSCDLFDIYSDYRGTNLLENSGLSSGEWTPDQDQLYYLNFSAPAEASALDITGLSEGADIYRLELPNLFPNGDFETSTTANDTNAYAGIQPAGWEATDGSTPIPLTSTFYNEVISSGPGAITNNTLYFDNSTDPAYNFRYNLRDSTYGLLDGFINDKTYLLRFDFRADNVTVFQRNDGISNTTNTWYVETSNSISELRYFPLPEIDPQFTAEGTGTWYFSIGTLDTENQVLQDGYLDNIRIIRTDIPHAIRLRLPISDPAGLRPDLINGTYSFSVYIKTDPTSTYGSDPVPNRFPASSICLGIRILDGDTPIWQIMKVFSSTEEGVDWSAWNLISATFANVLVEAPPEYSGERTMELSLNPTNPLLSSLQDAGSILISSPSLIFLPEGE